MMKRATTQINRKTYLKVYLYIIIYLESLPSNSKELKEDVLKVHPPKLTSYKYLAEVSGFNQSQTPDNSSLLKN